jgi:hypothetical protein
LHLDGRLLEDLEAGLLEAKPLSRRRSLRAERPLAGEQIGREGTRRDRGKPSLVAWEL